MQASYEKSNNELEAFKKALGGMGGLYASLSTAVVQVKDMPERPPHLEGSLIAFTENADAVAKSALRE